jgi:hypothetical protein
MKHRVHCAGLAPLGVGLPGSSSARSERGVNGPTGPSGDKSDNAVDPGSPRVVSGFPSVALGSATATFGNFTALELEKIIPVFEAAGLNNQHEDTFKRNFPHLIRKVGKRKTGVKLRDAITLPPAP